jgi:hypothetical protein
MDALPLIVVASGGGRLYACIRANYIFKRMTRQQVLDLYFLEARSKLIDIAAFLDRAERAKGMDDFRLTAFRKALGQLRSGGADRARRALLQMSDLTSQPLKTAGEKGACGAPRVK